MTLRLTTFLAIFLLFSIPVNSQKPENSRFKINTLITGLDEPMELTSLPDGRILFVERKGAVKLYDPKLDLLTTAAEIDCNTKYTNAEGHVREAEEGLMGIVIDPNFEKNHWVYVYYSDPNEAKHILTRWDFSDDALVKNSRKVVLEIPTQRQECCHTGGGMVFDRTGNLYLTVGNNTSNSNSNGYAPLDERKGREYWDDQRGAANMNDLRGSVLKITPTTAGSYTIPEGNLFPKGTPKTRPEIYAKGARNPWRPTIDSETGYLYWGEVGTDAALTSELGPAGYDEFNQAKKSGFFGWPYFSGNNEPYRDLDFATGERGELFSVEKPINNSPNNTGPKELPSPTPAFIWYPYSLSEQFPLLGVSGRSATGVAIFHKKDFKKPDRLWPEYYEGKLLISDFMRGWIMAVSMDENSDYVTMERFLPQENFSSLIDMEFAPNGDLYLLKYGSSWFGKADNSALVRIEYNSGNRPPLAKIDIDKTNGAVPLSIGLNSGQSSDPDGEELSFYWELIFKEKTVQNSAYQNPRFEIFKSGNYTLKLTATDTKGASTTSQVQVLAGNTAPEIDILIENANSSFYFTDKVIDYEVLVQDAEDGNLDFSEILPSEISVNIDYVPESFDPVEISSNYATTDMISRFNSGFKLISGNDCGSCHMVNEKSIGPSYQDVAERYKKDKEALANLSTKVISGGSGVWGDHAMAAHPQLSETAAKSMVSYILSFTEPALDVRNESISGSFLPSVPAGETGYGGYAIRAAYEDKGAKKVAPLLSEKIHFLTYPFLDPRKANIQEKTELVNTPSRVLQFFGKSSHIGFENIDLKGIKSVDLLVQASKRTFAAGGIIEIHKGKPDGPIIGRTTYIPVQDDGDIAELSPKEAGKRIRKLQQQKLKEGAAEYFMGHSRVMNIPIDITNDLGDLFFVCVSPKADENQVSISLSGVEFNTD